MSALDHRGQISGEPAQLGEVRLRRGRIEALFDRAGELRPARQAQCAEQPRQLMGLGPDRFSQLQIVRMAFELGHGTHDRRLALEQRGSRTRPDRGQSVAQLILLGGVGHEW